MERRRQKVLCINLEGLFPSLEDFNFLRINWEKLIQKCSGREELEIRFDHWGSLYYIS
jgi:hypothetical protein